MQRVEQNYIYGIRTPWTLKNKEVWRLTNRFSANIFFRKIENKNIQS
ncbi:SdpI family protein [Bacillus cereus group sp. BfR-BA-01393]|nr:SdpI family protein [Bacillus cereus group sp. BfR-BA-01393]